MTGEKKESEEQRTRQRVLSSVLADGPITASALAKDMGLTPAAIRRHLDALCAEGLIEVRDFAGKQTGRGRPARHYVVTSEGHTAISHSYDELAVEILDFVQHKLGDEAIEEFAVQAASELGERIRNHVDKRADSVSTRSRDLAHALSREGYAASATPVAAGTPLEAMQLCQGHCPIRAAAEKYPEFCDAELEMFARYLGVDVRRLSTLANGDHVCTTHVPTSALTRPLIHDTDHNQGGSR